MCLPGGVSDKTSFLPRRFIILVCPSLKFINCQLSLVLVDRLLFVLCDDDVK
jgi:hypothetical protein